MIETNMQHQQHDMISQEQSHPDTEVKASMEVGPTIACTICEALYAPSPQQVPFLQYMQGALEATFMEMCHFCFRCRRAACPQCWDEVHGVCGSCVQEARLLFRAGATPLDGLMFPPTSQPSLMSSQGQSNSLFVSVRNGHFYSEAQVKSEPAPKGITNGHTLAVQPAVVQTDTPDSHITAEKLVDLGTSTNKTAQAAENHLTDKVTFDTPTAVAIPAKTPLLEDSQGTGRQEGKPRAAKKGRKASRLELALTWIVLVIVLALVFLIALAEFTPAANVLVARMTHIDIHAEIAYLVHIVQQFFKK